MIYAGIGSRETPDDHLQAMYETGIHLAQAGWTLRSGYAGGADMAFYQGCVEAGGKFENFIPWAGFNDAPRNDPRFIIPTFNAELFDIAQQFHPAWHRCSDGAKKLHARNGCQILGRDLNTPVDLVICWTKGALGLGGTGQAIRIARSRNIPVFDVASEPQRELLKAFFDKHIP